jgi:DNA-binding transcriptional MerR regulator
VRGERDPVMEGRMKVSELAHRAGVSKETIHFYLREGLLPKPQKVGKNLAFYDETHLSRLLLIKKLQKERYLPLDVIKRVLADGRGHGSAEDLELLGELLALTTGMTSVAEGSLAKAAVMGRTQVTSDELLRLAAEGVVAEHEGRYDAWDVRAIELYAQARTEAGYAPSFAASLFGLYRRHLETLAQSEAKEVFQALLTAERPLEYVRGLRRARGATNRYLLLMRARLIQREIEAYVAEVERAVEADHEPPLWPASPSLKARGANDRAALDAEGDLDALEARLDEAVKQGPGRGLPRALLGATLVRKARQALLSSQGSAFELCARGLAELNGVSLSDREPEADVLLARLVRGRAYVSMPHFYGSFELGVRDLQAVCAVDPGRDATRAWLKANACYFLGTALWREPSRQRDAQAALATAVELDLDGPLSRCVKERA